MEPKMATERNRVASALDTWKRIEEKLVARYGRNIIKDREFLKAKRDIQRHVHNKYKKKPLNLFEKSEMRVLRGQRRAVLRQLYPNPYVRLARNLLVFAANVLAAGGKLLLQFGKLLTATAPNPLPAPAKEQTATQKKEQTQKTGTKQQQTKKTAQQNKAVIRKLPVHKRKQVAAAPGKGIRH